MSSTIYTNICTVCCTYLFCLLYNTVFSPRTYTKNHITKVVTLVFKIKNSYSVVLFIFFLFDHHLPLHYSHIYFSSEVLYQFLASIVLVLCIIEFQGISHYLLFISLSLSFFLTLTLCLFNFPLLFLFLSFFFSLFPFSS